MQKKQKYFPVIADTRCIGANELRFTLISQNKGVTDYVPS